MKSNSFLRLIIFFMCIIGSFSVRAEVLTEEEAKIFGQTKGQELLNTFAEPDLAVKYQKLDELFLDYIDLAYISRFVLGKYWHQLDKTQQQEYQALFVRYAINVYKGFPLTFSKDDIDFAISSARTDGKDILLSTDIKYQENNRQDVEFSVEFRLHKKDGRVLITDIKVAEKSLILSYRNKFYEMFRQADEEPEWFLEDFAILTSSTEKYYQKKSDSE